MHTGKFYSMFFLVAVLCIAIPLGILSYLSGLYTQAELSVKRNMDQAVVSAMKETKITDGKAFGSGAARANTLNAFYGGLAAAYGNLNGSSGNRRIGEEIPFVLLADTDGVYVGTRNSGTVWNEEEDANQISPIQVYAANYMDSSDRDYEVRFYMDQTMVIRKNGALLYSGTYDHILEEIREEDLESLPFLKSEETFLQEASAIIKNTVYRAAEAKLNEDRKGSGTYSLSLNTDFWSPAVLSCARLDFPLYGHSASCLVSCASLVRKDLVYTAEGFYHKETCAVLSSKELTKVCTMEEAAERGYRPCPDCIR